MRRWRVLPTYRQLFLSLSLIWLVLTIFAPFSDSRAHSKKGLSNRRKAVDRAQEVDDDDGDTDDYFKTPQCPGGTGEPHKGTL